MELVVKTQPLDEDYVRAAGLIAFSNERRARHTRGRYLIGLLTVGHAPENIADPESCARQKR